MHTSSDQMLPAQEPGRNDGAGRTITAGLTEKRNGTTTLFAALTVLEGQVIRQCQQRHTHAEWLKFLRKIDRETPKEKTQHPAKGHSREQPLKFQTERSTAPDDASAALGGRPVRFSTT
jgi:hypothetical protein